MNSISSITLNWQDNGSGEEGFRIERKYQGSDWEYHGVSKLNSYSDTDFEFGSAISYRVCAYAGQYNSDFVVNSINAILLPPQNFQIANNSLASVNLSWTNIYSFNEGFKIERNYENTAWEALATTSNTIFIDDNFELNTHVNYRICAYAGEYISTWVTNDFSSIIPPPVNLQVSRNSISSAYLSWELEIDGEEGFRIERSSAGGAWEELAITNDEYFTDSNFELNKQIKYRVTAFYQEYDSQYSEIDFDSTIPPVGNFEIQAYNPEAAVLTWDYSVSGADGFKIDRKVNAGTWENEYASLAANQNSFTDNNLDLNNNVYHYRVYVYYGSYNSLKAIGLISKMCGYPFTDNRDGNVYETVLIDNQCWMKENLAYLPSVSPPWNWSETYPYYYVYDYAGSNVSNAKNTIEYETYGVLYNFPAAEVSCPQGWHLSSTQEWADLKEFVSGSSYTAGGKLKETGTTHWHYPNTGAVNVVDFTALPGGFANVWDSEFSQKSYFGLFWSFSQYGYHARKRMDYDDDDLHSFTGDEMDGVSVRCVRDE
jgi:uncharacterized protein (TIGR02145 family)